MHHAATKAGRGQAVTVSGEIWERLSVPEVRVCDGTATGVCGFAGEVLSGVSGALRQYGAVYDQGGGGVGLS